jgi:hypothetical protein
MILFCAEAARTVSSRATADSVADLSMGFSCFDLSAAFCQAKTPEGNVFVRGKVRVRPVWQTSSARPPLRRAVGAAAPRTSGRARPRGVRLVSHVLGNLRKPSFADHGLVAIAQNPLSLSTTCGFVKPAAMSVSINPVFGCPEYGVNPSAIPAPPFKTRRISRNPAVASGQTCMELIAKALSNILSSNGKLSAEPRRRSTLVFVFAFRSVACSTISSEGSTPATYPVDANPAKSWMPTPGPKPTSTTLSFGWMWSKSITQVAHS